MVALSIACSFVSSSVFVEVQDPIRLKYFGKKEILSKIDLMELEYDVPMTFDDAWIPSTPVAAGQNIGEWGYGIGVFGMAHGHAHECETPSLLADMCGFKSEEEMDDTKAYLQSHGSYQLKQVAADFCPFSCQFSGNLTSCFSGHRGGKITGHLYSAHGAGGWSL